MQHYLLKLINQYNKQHPYQTNNIQHHHNILAKNKVIGKDKIDHKDRDINTDKITVDKTTMDNQDSKITEEDRVNAMTTIMELHKMLLLASGKQE